MINTTDTPTKITIDKIRTQPLSDFDILDAEQTESFDCFNPARIQKLTEILQSQIPDCYRTETISLCTEFADIFTLDSDKATVNNFYTQKLNTKTDDAVYIKNYRLPHTQKVEIKTQVNNLLNKDLIEPSTSNFNSPVILVPKKSTNGEKKYRMCIDYRGVNKNLIPDKYPLPRIDDTLDSLGKAKFFSVIDMHSGFHQIPLEPYSRPMTSFSTENGAYQWKVVPFGLNVAPNSFARMMALAFQGIPLEICFLYMDDIIVIGKSENDHLKNLRTVFEVCRKRNLKINPNKCQFFRHEVTYLGHRCTRSGLLPDNSKLDAIHRYPKPTDRDSAKRFIAFANYYRRFIPNFAALAQPINKLTRKNSVFTWTLLCQESFEKLKQYLANPPILAFPDFSKSFIITVDASKLACGAVLSQAHDGFEQPIYYASKSFTKGEQNKATIEQELIAIHWAVKQFRPYIYGTTFLVRSDHKPLIYLFSLKEPSSRLTRIRLDLEEYSFTVQHIKGKDNVVADALSRITIEDLKQISLDINSRDEASIKVCKVQTRATTRKNMVSQSNIKVRNEKEENSHTKLNVFEALNNAEYKGIPIMKCKLIEDYVNGPQFLSCSVYHHRKCILKFDLPFVNDKRFLESLLSKLEKLAGEGKINTIKLSTKDKLFEMCTISEIKNLGTNSKILQKLVIVLTKPRKHIENREDQLNMIKLYHDDPLFGGHKGTNRLYAELRSNFHWENMSKDISKYVKNCHKCQMNKVKAKNIEPQRITSTPQVAFDKIVIDTIGPMQRSENGNYYAVTMMCDLSKFLITVPIPTKDAKTVARAIFEKLILIYGPVREILTDCGTEYMNKVLNELLELFKIQHSNSTPYHHETVGTIERNHRVLNEYLRAYLPNNTLWEEYLPFFTFCYNISPHISYDAKYTPFELVFGRKCPTPNILHSEKIDPIYNIDNYALETRYKLQTAQKIAHDLINKSKYRAKLNADKRSNPINVNIDDKVILIDETRGKHDPLYTGPYKIIEIIGENVKILDINKNKNKLVHKNNIRKYMK